MHRMWCDTVFGVRLWAKSPLFALTLFLLLTLGVGANVVVFSVVNAVLFKGLQIDSPHSVVRVHSGRGRTTYEDYLTYRDANGSLSILAIFTRSRLSIDTAGPSEVLEGTIVSGNYFEALRINVGLGRPIRSIDDQLGSQGVVVIADGLWRTRFGADPDVLSQTLEIEGKIFQIVGVAPPGFEGVGSLEASKAWVAWNSPLNSQPSTGEMIGRLKTGVSIASAQADLSRVASGIPSRGVNASPDVMSSVTVYPARVWSPEVLRQAKVMAVILQGLVAIIFVAICSNIGILVCARFNVRQNEFAIRRAVGATRSQLCRQTLTESLLVSGPASCGALLLAQFTLTAIHIPLPGYMPESLGLDLRADWRVVLFATVACVAAALLFGWLPGAHGSSSLSRRIPGSSLSGVPRNGLRTTMLVACQFALSALLLVSAGTTLRNTVRFQGLDRGFDTAGVWTADLNLGRFDYPEEDASQFHDEMLRKLSVNPKVIAVSLARRHPLWLSLSRSSVIVETEEIGESRDARTVEVSNNLVSPRHFETLGIPIIVGRDFKLDDNMNVGIVNETLARRLWPDQSPLSKRLRNAADGTEIEIIGLARDSKYASPLESSMAFLYLPLTLTDDGGQASVLIKTKDSHEATLSIVRNAAYAIDPAVWVPSQALWPIDGRLNQLLLRFYFLSFVGVCLACLALVLGIVGTYGLVAGTTALRTREIGIRMAVGARPHQIFGAIVKPTVTWTMAGVGVGFVASMLLARVLGNDLYGGLGAVPGLAEYTFAAAVLLIVSAVAAYRPVRRVVTMDSAIALREE